MNRQTSTLVIAALLLMSLATSRPPIVRAQAVQKTRIIDRVLDAGGHARRGKVTFILTQKVSGPSGIIAASGTVSATLDTSGRFDIQVYPSSSLTPAAYYQVWFTTTGSTATELLGIYNIPSSTTIISLGAYKVTDTNLAAQYTFASVADVNALVSAVSTATLAELNAVSRTDGKLQLYKAASGTFEDSAVTDNGSTVTIGRNTTVSGNQSVTGNQAVSGNQTVTGTMTANAVVGDGSGLTNVIPNSPTFSGTVTAGAFVGNGAGLTGVTGATGGVSNTGSTTIGADADSDDAGVVDLQTRTKTRMRIDNDGEVVLYGPLGGSDLPTVITAFGSTQRTLRVETAQSISNNLTIPATVTTTMGGQGQITVTSGKVLTINGPFVAPPRKVFAGAGSVVFGPGAVAQVRVEWFGTNTTPGTTDMSAALQAAINAAGNSGGTVDLLPIKYAFSVTLTNEGPAIGTNNPVWIVGQGVSLPLTGIANAQPVTTLKWIGSSGGKMLSIKRSAGGGLRNVMFDGNSLAATGVYWEASHGVTWENVAVVNTVAGASTDSAYVLHAGVSPNQESFAASHFKNIAATNVAKGMLLTSGDVDTDVCWNVFSGLYIQFSGAWGLRIEAGDNNDFFNYMGLRQSGTGDQLQLKDASGSLFGARYNYFYHLEGGGAVAGAPIVSDISVSGVYNACVFYDTSNGMPVPTGTNPERFIVVGGFGGNFVSQSRVFELINATNSNVLDVKVDPDTLPAASPIQALIPGNASGRLRSDRAPFTGSSAGGALTPNCRDYDAEVITLTGNVTSIAACANPTPGGYFTLTFVQDGTGGRTVGGWNAVWHQAWANTGNTAAKESSITFQYDGAVWHQVAYVAYF